jgi:hypothetical protein
MASSSLRRADVDDAGTAVLDVSSRRFLLRQGVAMDRGPVERFAAQSLLDWLSKPGRYRFVRVGDGAQILASSESALAEARAALQRLYGPLVRFGTPWMARPARGARARKGGS